jgi:hypothetical protein
MIEAGYQVEDKSPIDLMAREASWGSTSRLGGSNAERGHAAARELSRDLPD